MSAFTEWQSTAFVQGAVGETRTTRDFADLGYEHKARANWDMQFNGTYTRTTFVTFDYPYTDRDANDFVAEWTNLITLTPKDRLTVGTPVSYTHLRSIAENYLGFSPWGFDVLPAKTISAPVKL